jgi:peroxisomal 3,2-trans-enoyl-CoA isomerase
MHQHCPFPFPLLISNSSIVGLSAALTAHSDFIYSTPHAYLLTPFSSLGLVTEGGAALALVKRLGVSKANEALLMSRKVDASTMLATGYVNRIFSEGGGDKDTGKGCDSQKFLERVMAEVNEMLGDHLNKESLLGIKKMVKSLDEGRMEKVGVREVMAGLERFVGGAPQREFEAIRKGEKRHKL